MCNGFKVVPREVIAAITSEVARLVKEPLSYIQHHIDALVLSDSEIIEMCQGWKPEYDEIARLSSGYLQHFDIIWDAYVSGLILGLKKDK